MPPFELRWKTYNHIDHPYGDLIWHLFWGFIMGIAFVYAVVNYDFWFLVICVIGLIFFFHPGFYKPQLMEIKITNEGLYVDKNFYPWDQFAGFEIFENELRSFIFFIPKKLSFGLHVPIEEFFVSKEEVREKLKMILEEVDGSVPLMFKIYRAFFL